MDSYPKPSGDDPATFRAPLRRRLFSSPLKEDFRRNVVSWFTKQLNHAEPWDVFADTTQFSIPKSAQEVTHRIQWNMERFRRNYGILFAVIMVGCIMSSMTLMVTVAAVGAVCAVLRVQHDEETVAVLGSKLMLSKNHRQVLAALVAFTLLYASDIWSTITWSLGVIAAVSSAHASLYGQLDYRKRPDDLEELHSFTQWSPLTDISFY